MARVDPEPLQDPQNVQWGLPELSPQGGQGRHRPIAALLDRHDRRASAILCLTNAIPRKRDGDTNPGPRKRRVGSIPTLGTFLGF